MPPSARHRFLFSASHPPGAGEPAPADVSLAVSWCPPTAGVVPRCDRGGEIGHFIVRGRHSHPRSLCLQKKGDGAMNTHVKAGAELQLGPRCRWVPMGSLQTP